MRVDATLLLHLDPLQLLFHLDLQRRKLRGQRRVLILQRRVLLLQPLQRLVMLVRLCGGGERQIRRRGSVASKGAGPSSRLSSPSLLETSTESCPLSEISPVSVSHAHNRAPELGTPGATLTVEWKSCGMLSPVFSASNLPFAVCSFFFSSSVQPASSPPTVL